MLERSCCDAASHNGRCRLWGINYRQIKEHQSKLPQTWEGAASILVLHWTQIPSCTLGPPSVMREAATCEEDLIPLTPSPRKPSADSKRFLRRPRGRAPNQLAALENNKRNVGAARAPVPLLTTGGQARITACAVIGCRGGETLASNLAQTADFNPWDETVAQPEHDGPGSLRRAPALLSSP